MLYHYLCSATDAREWGHPLECKQMFSNGTLEYQCPACGEVFSFHEDDFDLPHGITETDNLEELGDFSLGIVETHWGDTFRAKSGLLKIEGLDKDGKRVWLTFASAGSLSI